MTVALPELNMSTSKHELKVNMAERGKPKNIKSCTLTLDWDGMDAELIKELATERVLAGVGQRLKMQGHVPSEYTYKVADFGTRKRDPLAALRTLTLEQLRAFCAERGLEVAGE